MGVAAFKHPLPPHSPDPATNDYDLFRSLQNSLKGKLVSNGRQIQDFPENIFASKPAELYSKGIKELPDKIFLLFNILLNF